MTEKERTLLKQLYEAKISEQELEDQFPKEKLNDSFFIISELENAIQKNDKLELEYLIPLIWIYMDLNEEKTLFEFTDVLNQLLVFPHHESHQFIAKTLQKIKSPSTIPFVVQVLETNFSFLDYTVSEHSVIAKWFSWLLRDIGTTQAIQVIQHYSNSPNEGIREEMLYRLTRLKKK